LGVVLLTELGVSPARAKERQREKKVKCEVRKKPGFLQEKELTNDDKKERERARERERERATNADLCREF